MKDDILKSFTHLDKQINVILRRHPTARRMRLRIDIKTGNPIVIMPKYCTQKSAIEFAISNASWILAKQKSNEPKIIIANNETINIIGQSVTIRHQNKLRGITEIIGDELQIYGEEQILRKKVIDFIKEKMKRYVTETVFKYSARIGVVHSDIKIKDTSSRWGSCNSNGEISICWKLAFAPVPVIDYIIIHEVVHLKHFDHSDRFWKTVEKYFPEHEKAQKWLSQNQTMLQNIG